MDKIWLRNYPPGVPAEINVNEYQSLGELFEKSVATFRDKPAFTCMGKTISYGELDRLSRNFAAFLQNQLKLSKGARIAIMLPNTLQYPVCMFGALRAGYTVVNVNPLYTAHELEYQLSDAGAETIVVIENFASVLEEALPKTPVKNVIVTNLGALLGFPISFLVNFIVRHVKKRVPRWNLPTAINLSAALSAGSGMALQPVDVNHEDIAFLQYTGGTTGVSKGAMLLHRNIIANLQQVSAWISGSVREGTETIITALPLYHIFSLTANCLTFMKFGAQNILITNPRDIPGFVKTLRRCRFTAITGVNTLFNALLNHPDFASVDFSNLRIALGGGMAVQKTSAERWKTLTGVTLIEAYGLTETSPAACINPLTLENYNGKIGLPIPSTDIEIRDTDGRQVAEGQPGELCIRGPQVMKGYWKRPDETAKIIDAHGFLATGDVVVIDKNGYIQLVDRIKDMILVSGFKVFPNEIEAVVAACPGVLEVACVGIPDEKSGEAVKIFVVRKDGALTLDQVIAYCRANLTAYKVPRHVEFRTDLPKSSVGKILRRELRNEIKTE